MTMTADMEALSDAVALVIRDAVVAGTAPLLKRIEELEKRLAGEWKAETVYRKHEVVLLRGRAWRCSNDTTQAPGETDAWALCE